MLKRFVETILIIASVSMLTTCAYAHRDDMRYGWAKRLDGRTAVVPIFVDEDVYRWEKGSDKDKALMLKYLEIACAYLEESCAGYGADTELIYEGLEMDGVISGSLTGERPDTEAVDEFLYSEEMSQRRDEILKQNRCDGIVYLLFINVPAGYPYSSQSYMWMAQGDPEDEFSLIYSYKKGLREGPSVIAHELLHSFGAPDLYTQEEEGYELGITGEYVEQLRAVESNDLMFSVYDRETGGMTYDRVTKEFTPVDAYYTGLLDECVDVEKYGLGRSIYLK